MKDLIIEILKKKSPYPITSTEIIGEIFKYRHKRISPSEIRKIINEIRRNGEYPVLASSNGYYISLDKEEIMNEIQSLRNRAMKILSAAQGRKLILKQNNQLTLWEN